MKILIIEDDLNLRKVLTKALKKQKYEVTVAKNGVQGIIETKTEKPDLVLLDLMMPKMDGFEVISAFRTEIKEFKKIPIIVMSAKKNKEDVIKAIKLGCNDYITKPFNMDELFQKLQKLVKD